MICRNCYIGYMTLHQNLEGWRRCPLCSYNAMEKEIITLQNYLTANGRYKDRENHSELTDEYKSNARKLLDKVNALLYELKIKEADVTSGFRPNNVNSQIANAAKKSNHTICAAVDILDDYGQNLAKKITLALLEKYDLYMESPDHTKGKNTNWVHLQIVKTKSGKRIFIP